MEDSFWGCRRHRDTRALIRTPAAVKTAGRGWPWGSLGANGGPAPLHANAAKPVKVPALAWLNNFLASVHLFLTIEVCLFPHLGRQGVPTRRRWRGGDRGAEGRRPRPSVFPGSNESAGHRECNIHCEWGNFSRSRYYGCGHCSSGRNSVARSRPLVLRVTAAESPILVLTVPAAWRCWPGGPDFLVPCRY